MSWTDKPAQRIGCGRRMPHDGSLVFCTLRFGHEGDHCDDSVPGGPVVFSEHEAANA